MKNRWLKWGMTIAGALTLWLALGGTTAAQESLEEVARSVNTVWVMLAAFLVFFMQAGFAALEAGSTRSKNTVNILMKNLLDFCFATLAFWAVGYAFMFGEGTALIGLQGFFLNGLDLTATDGIPVLAFWLFQLVFAGTAATIVSGAMAERTQFKSYLIYSVVITAFIYPIFGHWVWGGGWLSTLPFGGGFLDFAGSTVVHSVGGWAALMGAIVVGPRIGRFSQSGESKPIPGHSLPLMALGVFILWLGWFGFNPGSQLAAASNTDANAIALVAATTNIAAATGALGALLLGWMMKGKPDLSLALNGVIGGLVAITAPCAFVTPGGAAIIGLVGGAVVVLGMALLESLKIDDPVGAVPAHLMAGVWGTLALGLFATDYGLFYGHGAGQLIAQLIGIIACGVWTGGTAFLMFFAIKAITGLRVTPEQEEMGLDIGEHGATAYVTPLTGEMAGSLPSGSSSPSSGSSMGQSPARY
jgi:Amt family ammonium transporter